MVFLRISLYFSLAVGPFDQTVGNSMNLCTFLELTCIEFENQVHAWTFRRSVMVQMSMQIISQVHSTPLID